MRRAPLDGAPEGRRIEMRGERDACAPGASAAHATRFRRQRTRRRPAQFDPGQAGLEIIRTGHNKVDACCRSALIRQRKGDGAAANYRPCLNVKARPPWSGHAGFKAGVSWGSSSVCTMQKPNLGGISGFEQVAEVQSERTRGVLSIFSVNGRSE
jgi:hypothetical protein